MVGSPKGVPFDPLRVRGPVEPVEVAVHALRAPPGPRVHGLTGGARVLREARPTQVTHGVTWWEGQAVSPSMNEIKSPRLENKQTSNKSINKPINQSIG